MVAEGDSHVSGFRNCMNSDAFNWEIWRQQGKKLWRLGEEIRRSDLAMLRFIYLLFEGGKG